MNVSSLPRWEDMPEGSLVRVALMMGKLTDDYLPWRQLRFQKPPAEASGLSVTQWWFALRMAREAQARRLPTLLTTSGEPFWFVLTDRVLADTDFVASQLSGQVGMALDVVDDPNRDRYVRSALEEEAITSSQLEGAVTTRKVAKDMLRSGRSPRDVSERMIANNFAAMQRVRELKDEALTPALVMELQAIVTKGTLADPADAGRLQEVGEERVVVVDTRDDTVVHRPPGAAELSDRLARLCDFANGLGDGPYMPAVLRALTLHFMVSHDHYFVDGNGRTARALFYWAMLHHGYWLAEYLTISTILRKAPVQYSMSFTDTEQDGGDLTYFFLYHLGVLRRAIDGLDGYIKRTIESQRAIRRRLDPASGEFNLRQITMLGDLARDPDQSLSATVVAARFAVTDQTARTDLDDLVRRGLLTRARDGHRYIWWATDTLPGALTEANSK